MRLKRFTAPDIRSAMRLVRQELGDSAIIVSSRQGENGAGVRLIAAVEQNDEDVRLDSMGSPRKQEEIFTDVEHFSEHLVALLSAQGVSQRLTSRLVDAAQGLRDEGPVMALAAALDEVFRFAPLELPTTKPIILLGPNGSGKTTVAAKLATRACAGGLRFKVISTDTVRAGAIEQLACFTRILKTDLVVAGEAETLMREVESAQNHDLVVIDTPGVNPRGTREIASLAATIESIGAEPLLVIAAGGDPDESAEMAMAFSIMAPRRLVATRLDAVKRLGGILSAAEAGQLRYANISVSASVASDIQPINPVSLARMLIGENVTAGLAFAPQATARNGSNEYIKRTKSE